MIQLREWIRVSKSNPCPVCEKPDWCTFTEDGVTCCMRMVSPKPTKNGGWLHRSGEPYTFNIPSVLRSTPKPIETIDAFSLWSSWNKQLTPKSLIIFSEKIGVDPMALKVMGCVWAYPHNAWGFPMKDENSNIIGIRLRNEIGQKWAVKGSKQGLFIPEMEHDKKTLFIVEGPTDCAACLTLGFYSIGRPSCLGGDDMIKKFCSINRFKEIVIVADNDAPGIAGAKKLKSHLGLNSCLLTLPTKDMREFLANEGDRKTIESMIRNLVWSKN